MRRPKTRITDFQFRPAGHGHYLVTYVSPTDYKEFTAVIDDMTLIDATKNTLSPKGVDLENLKRRIKWNIKNR